MTPLTLYILPAAIAALVIFGWPRLNIFLEANAERTQKRRELLKSFDLLVSEFLDTTKNLETSRLNRVITFISDEMMDGDALVESTLYYKVEAEDGENGAVKEFKLLPLDAQLLITKILNHSLLISSYNSINEGPRYRSILEITGTIEGLKEAYNCRLADVIVLTRFAANAKIHSQTFPRAA